MGLMQTAAQIWRDFVTDGVPSSGRQKPKKSDIRAWGTWVESIINAFISTGGLIYTSRASLFADLARGANTIAWVIGDATVAYNGVYMKVGASGTGSWTRVADLPYSFVKLIDAGAGTANAIQLTSAIPASAFALRVANVFRANTGNVTISENGTAAKPLLTSSGNQIAPGGLLANMMISYVDDGANFRLLSDQASAAIVAAAEEAADRAEDARDAALSAVPNAFPATRAAMQALNTGTVASAYLKEAGRQGQFSLHLISSLSASMQAMVSADVLQAVSVPSTQDSNYVWIRSGMWPTTGILGAWFGFVSDAANPINASTTEGTGPFTINPNGPFQKAFDFCADFGFTLLVDQRYFIKDYLMMKIGARMRCLEFGELVAASSSPQIGGFITGRYNLDLSGSSPVSDVVMWDLKLDLNSKAAMNGLAITNFTAGRFHGATRIKNSLYDATYKGGRAVQFEGGSCEDIHIDELYISNCSIGVNSQALPANSTAKHISYGKVVMKNVGMPFNIDCTDAGSSAMLPNRMSTTIGTAVLNNCGRPAWLASADRFKAGIITGDRGSGLYIGDLRVVNDDNYGLVGGLFKGTMYGVIIAKAAIYGQFNCLADFNYLDFISGASAASQPSWVEADVSYAGGLAAMPRLLDTKSGGGSLGPIMLRLKADPALVTAICGINANTYNSGQLTLVDATSGIEYPQMSPRQAYLWGNTFPLLSQPSRLTRTRQDMDSATPRTMLTVAVPNNGRAALKLKLVTFGVGSSTTAATKIEEFDVAICRDGGGALTSAVTAGVSAQALDGYSSLTHSVAVADGGSGLANINVTVTNSAGVALTTSAIAEILAATAGASIVPTAPTIY